MSDDDLQEQPTPAKKPRHWGYVYILRHPDGPPRIKIGFTQTDPTPRDIITGPKNRIEHLSFALLAFGLRAVEVVDFFQDDYAKYIEQALHVEFQSARITVDAGTATEMFEVDAEKATVKMRELKREN